jgi:hypothetical protein
MLGAACFARPAGRLPLSIGTAGSLGLVGFLAFALVRIDTTHAAASATEQVAQVRVPELPPPPVEAPPPREAGLRLPDPTAAGGVATEVAKDAPGGHTDPPGLALGKKDGPFSSKSGFGGKGGLGGGSVSKGKTGPEPPGGLEKFTPKNPASGPDVNIAPGGGTGGTVSPAPPTAVPPPYPAPPGAGFTPPKSPLPKGYGWQKNSERKLVSDDLIETTRDTVVRVPSGVKKADRGSAATAQADSKPADKAVVVAAPADADVYFREQEVARQHADSLRKQLADWAGRRPGQVADLPPTMPIGPATGTGKLVFGQAAGAALNRVQAAVPVVTPLVVREYAAPRPGSSPTAGYVTAESDTILWQPVIVLPSDGKATLNFALGNAAGYQVVVAGHTLDGRLGAVRRVIPVAPAERAGQVETGPPVTPAGQPAPPAPVKP